MDPEAILLQALKEQGIDLDDLSPEELASITETINAAVSQSQARPLDEDDDDDGLNGNRDDGETDDEEGTEAALVMLREGGEATYREHQGGQEPAQAAEGKQKRPAYFDEEEDDDVQEEEVRAGEQYEQQQDGFAAPDQDGPGRPRRASYLGTDGQVDGAEDEEADKEEEDTSKETADVADDAPRHHQQEKSPEQRQRSGTADADADAADLDALPKSRKSLAPQQQEAPPVRQEKLARTPPRQAAAPSPAPAPYAYDPANPTAKRSPNGNGPVNTHVIGGELQGESVPVMMPLVRTTTSPGQGQLQQQQRQQGPEQGSLLRPYQDRGDRDDHHHREHHGLPQGEGEAGGNNTYPSVADVFARNSIGGGLQPPLPPSSTSYASRRGGHPPAAVGAPAVLPATHYHAYNTNDSETASIAPSDNGEGGQGGDDGYVLVLLSSLQANAAAVAEAEAELRTVVRER